MAKIKFTAAQALAFINKLGVDAEIVADDQADNDFNEEDAIKMVDESRGKIIKPDLEAALRTDLTTSIAGKHGGELRAHLRRLSNNVLKTSDLKDLKDEEALQKFLEVMVGQKDASLEDIRTQMKNALEEAEAEKTRLLSEKDTAYNALKTKYTERDIDSLLEEELNNVPRTGGNIKVQAQLAKTYLRGKYKDYFDENAKKIELRDLANPDKPALNGQVAVKLNDVLTEFAKENGILKTDMRDVDPTKHTGGSGGSAPIMGNTSLADDMKSFEALLT